MAKTFDRPAKSPKYQNQGSIAKKLVGGFFNSIENLLDHNAFNTNPMRVIEIGAGEGHVSQKVIDRFPDAQFYLTDVYDDRLDLSKKLLSQKPNVHFQFEDINNIQFEDDYFDLIICCEVLEHIDNYQKGLNEIYRVLKPEGLFLASVPREPIWRVLNMIRLKYLKDMGNTPTHVNHWSSVGFRKLIKKNNFVVLKENRPLPWTMILSQKPS